MKNMVLFSWFFALSLSVKAGENVSFQAVMVLEVKHQPEQIAYGQLPLQYGLWWPGEKDKPLLIMIHGGCWLNAFDVNHLKAMASALADQGFSVWAPEYRRTGDEGGGWPGSFEDIQMALRHTKQLPTVHKSQVLMGHSAGGHLALLATADGLLSNRKLTIGLAAIADLPTYAKGDNGCQKAGVPFMGGTEDELADAYRAADPQQKGQYKDTLLLQGDADVIVPVSQAQLSGAKTDIIEKAGHFDWIHPQTPAFSHLLAVLNSLK